ncbi:MAG: flagellar biosynthesis protein FlhA [Planctomycetaceae bacterium]
MTQPSPYSWLRNSDTLLSLCFLMVLGIIVFPIPSLLLDLCLAINMGVAVLLFLVTLGTRRALDLSAFPSLLLMLTLYRISLNVATTRSILLSSQAGKLVSTFGEMVVGGNLVVGLVIFLILVIIQFIVITKGAGRVSEVAARFTLDALPGKQMSIDAELNAGTIDEPTARERRRQLGLETEFYGAMDGASKFVRGDAIAGLVITGINLLGGVAIGISNGMSPGESIQTFGVLTVGDGLVSQIPALFIATASGILITKSNSENSLGSDVGEQLFKQKNPLWLGAFVLGIAALIPGMPRLPFLALSGGLIWYLRRQQKPQEKQRDVPTSEESQPVAPTNALEDFLHTDRAAVEVGARLVSLMTSKQGRPFSHRITLLRKDLSRQRGIWIPEIRVRSNLELPVEAYRILIGGREVARGDLRVNQHLAIHDEGTPLDVPGEETVDPAFGFRAKWLSEENASLASARGFTVVDAPSVLITHLGEVLKEFGHELITRDTVKEMLDQVHAFAPSIVDEVRSENIRIAVIHQMLKQLAQDGVPLADMALILEAVSNQAAHAKTADELTDAVRQELGRLVCDRYCTSDGELRVIIFDPRLEKRLREVVREGHVALGPVPLENLTRTITRHWHEGSQHDQPLALLVDRSLRRPLRNLLNRQLKGLGFIAYQEVHSDLALSPIALINEQEVFPLQSRSQESAENIEQAASQAA